MGNHEWCTDCHEKNFHYGRPCDPAKRKVVQDAKAREAKEQLQREQLLQSYGLQLYEGEFGNGHYSTVTVYEFILRLQKSGLLKPPHSKRTSRDEHVSQAAARLGSTTSVRKASAARENGRAGGRPKKSSQNARP